ncbi:MAG: hypothetical protein HEEMFOPI_00668 [Holosporales bacterium]
MAYFAIFQRMSIIKMVILFMSFMYNLFLTLLIFVSFVLPDVILGHLFHLISSVIDEKTFIIYFTFSLLLSFVRQKWILMAILIGIQFLQIIQINHCLYFGVHLDPGNLVKILSEVDEIMSSGIGSAGRLWPGWLVCGACVLLMGIIFISLKTLRRYTYRWMFVLPISVFLAFPTLILIQGTKVHRAGPQQATLHHSIRALSLAINYELLKNNIKNKYLPYEKTTCAPSDQNIILVIGESVSAKYMSLYDYPHPTTPYLNSLKSDSTFAYAKGISSSISTVISLTCMLNIIREPTNLEHLRQKNFNIFKLAKEQGYKTVCITAQEVGLFNDSCIKDMDEFISVSCDEEIFEKLSKLNFHEKNFIVLHVRHVHSPYATFHTKEPEFKIDDRVVFDYAKALLYHDDWIKQLIKKVQTLFKAQPTLVFTSDHGELLGEDGCYGHSILNPKVTNVPVWVMARDDHPLLSFIRNKKFVNHYELMIQVAKMMGIQIHNPNDDGQTYFVQGFNFFIPRYIKYIKKHDGVEFCDIDD